MTRRRRAELFEQPSLVPMADMVTNTVGIMLFILIFVSLSAGGVVVSRHLPRERATHSRPVWLFCSAGKIVSFDAEGLGSQMAKRIGEPSNSVVWARAYSSQRILTSSVEATGQAEAGYGGLRQSVVSRPRPDRGDDEAAIKNSASAFQKLLAEKSTSGEFLYFFVSPDSVRLFRAARDLATQYGFSVGWTPASPGGPAVISLSGNGREATIQ